MQTKRTFQDKVISGFNSCRFALLEPIKLQIARTKYERLYRNSIENPLVSVYTPTYNRAELLIERAVTSVLAQTYTNFEFIIIGDHCTDDTEELIAQINDPRIRFYNLPKRGKRYPDDVEIHWLAGPVVAANKALKLCSGKWIARIDDDDIWTPDHIETLLRFAQQGNYEFVSASCGTERYGKKIIVDGEKLNSSYFTKNENPDVDLNDNSPKMCIPSTWFYRSYLRFFKFNINCWRKSWNRVNDIDLVLRMYNAGVRMNNINQVVTYMLPRTGEETIGWDAYNVSEHEKAEHFKF